MKTFKLRINRSVYSVPLKDIIYMENDLRKIHLHLAGREYVFYGTFRQVLEQLDERFLHCSRSFIVNRDHIRALRPGLPYEIVMDDGSSIPLCRNTFSRVRAEFEQDPAYTVQK